MDLLRLRTLLFSSLFLFSGILTTATGQSVNKNAPAPMTSSSVSASVDSLIGPHYWYFFAEPGAFRVSFGRGSAEGLGASGKATIQCGFSPETPGAVMTVKSSPEGAIFSGTVKQRTRVGIRVDPPNSPLIRSTVSYSIAVTGSAAFGAARDAGPAIAGMYNTGYGSPLGAVRFNANGTVEASNGQTGTWKLFDQETATYVVVLDGKRNTYKLDPGRGLINVQSTNIEFTKAH